MELVDNKIRMYNTFMDRININRPNISPRATGHINEMIEMIKILIEKDHAYVSEGSVYFDINSFSDYGKMAKLDLENLKAGARVDVIESKRNPGDFAIWIKAPKEHVMKYNSPWSIGYPGWHLECSVMSKKYLGDTLDIHSGGIDHIPVHHTNEIAQSESSNGKTFARYWMHSAFITVNGKKMSKSKNNFITLEELIKDVGSGVSRFALSEAHYRTQADFSLDQTQAIKKRYYRIIRSYHLGLQHLAQHDVILDNEVDQSEKFYNNFLKAMLDDLNTPLAVVQINSLTKQIDKFRKEDDIVQLRFHLNRLELLFDILGFPIIDLSNDEIRKVRALVALRIKMKQNGDFQSSDDIRDFLQDLGYVLQDLNKDETQWYKEELLV